MKKGKYIRQSEKQEKNVSPLKVTAIVLSAMAALLVLAAVGIGVFVWYSGSLRGTMFSSRGSVSDTLPQMQTTAPADTAPTEATEKTIDADWIDENGDAYNYRDEVISILLMGIDYMNDEKNWSKDTQSNGGNADVIGLVILDTQTFDFSILYIPRDTMADVIAMDAEGKYIDTVFTNISASHSYGDGKDLSCRLTEDAVSRLLYGVPVSRYAALDYDALYTLCDMVGGLTVTLDKDYKYIHPSFTAGSTVTLNRWYMNKFITYREDNLEGASDRGMRGMLVLKALFNQCKEEIVANPTVALDYFNELKAYITTDLDLTEITFLARNVSNMEFSSDTILRIPGETVMGDQYAEFYPDKEWLHSFVIDRFCVPAE